MEDIIEDIIIEDATPKESSLIADAILEAIGQDITMNLAGDKGKETVHEIFRRLAEKEDTQYSYKNTRIAKTPDGMPIGVCISYDGANLKKLRQAFFEEANNHLGWGMSKQEIENLPGETDEEEFYLDTLMTKPNFRGKGVGRALIIDAGRKATLAQKPLGLLCDMDNDKAYRLYKDIGFVKEGTRLFAGHEMYHLILK